MNLCGSIPCSNFFVKNDTCLGSIDIAVSGPQNISSCTGDVAMLCTAGSPTTTNQVQSFMQSVLCILGQIPTQQFLDVIKGVACTLVNVLNQAASAASVDITVTTALGTFGSALTSSLGLTCSSLTLPSLPAIGLPGLSG
ncbi:uncharacterized protein LOC125941895 [Dermacentor silvarum]|uniref:uncharacterized protein LOC125941895 n=1 Tax=Dermacentor silvarum TaxID=543639 RepID=UPI0021016A59|nr:uncharacterized protein LOC125941895 [Dermacentor silvarum]